MQHEPVSQLIRVNGASPPDVVLGDIDLVVCPAINC